MRIFSNFDTKLKGKIHDKWKKEYGEKNVLLLSKSKLFRFLKVDLPLILYTLTALILIYFFDRWFGKTGGLVGLGLTAFGLLFLIHPIMKSVIDYNMDFIIFTPKQLLRYDQGWILRRDVITINTHHIKTVSVRKNGLLYSIFDNGDIVFLSEGDVDHGEITLSYISKPESSKTKIAHIMGRY